MKMEQNFTSVEIFKGVNYKIVAVPIRRFIFFRETVFGWLNINISDIVLAYHFTSKLGRNMDVCSAVMLKLKTGSYNLCVCLRYQ